MIRAYMLREIIRRAEVLVQKPVMVPMTQGDVYQLQLLVELCKEDMPGRAKLACSSIERLCNGTITLQSHVFLIKHLVHIIVEANECINRGVVTE